MPIIAFVSRYLRLKILIFFVDKAFITIFLIESGLETIWVYLQSMTILFYIIFVVLIGHF